jgi:hypothetical protein
MGREVAEVRELVFIACGCSTCSTGIAIDIVGERWGEPEYDWRGAAFNHHCPLADKGPTPALATKILAIRAMLEGRPRDGGQLAAAV